MNFPEIKKFSLLTESETVATDHTNPNPDAESFMVEVERKVLEGYQRLNRDYEEQIINLNKTADENDKAYYDLAERYEKLEDAYNLLSVKYISERGKDKMLEQEIAALELRLSVKDSPIKAWLKRAWKWFKSTVGQ